MSLSVNNYTQKGFNVLLALTPTSLLFSPAVGSILLAVLTLFSVVCFFLSSKEALKLPFIYKILFYIYLVFLALHITGFFNSFDKPEAFSILRIRLPLLLIPFIFYVNFKIINFRLLLKIYVSVVILVATFTIFNSLYSIHLNNNSLEIYLTSYTRFFYISFMPYEMHPSYYGMFLCSSIAVLLNNNIFKLNLTILFCAILFFNVYMISAQMSTFICVALVGYFFLKQVEIFFGRIFFRTILVIGTLLILLLYFNAKLVTKTTVMTLNIENKSNILYRVPHFFKHGDITRRKNWVSACHVINKNIMLGVGIGDGVNEMQMFREKGSWIYNSRLNAHNQYLEEFVHFGLLGFICVTSFLSILVYFSKENMFYNSILFVILFSMITESILNRQVGAMLFSFLLCFPIFEKVKTLAK
jgi:O-antigen ligase